LTLRSAGLLVCIVATHAGAVGGVPTGAVVDNVFVHALLSGAAIEPIPSSAGFATIARALQRRTGDDSPVFVDAKRVVRFEQQARCGRVMFKLVQPASVRPASGLGAQLNICEDGLPPLRVCQDQLNVLVPATVKCRDGSNPQDTAEVAAAIQAAIAGGDINAEEARRRAIEQAKAFAAARAASGGAR
jgi:hypothetical protein